MAKAGITGAHNIIDGAYNFYHIYIHDKCDKSKLTLDLGKKFWIHTLSYKPYPVCGQCLSPVTDVEYLMKKHDIKAQEITGIDVGTNQHGYRACVEPEEVKFHPTRVVDGQFSIPFSVATMALKGHLTLSDLTEEGIQDSEVTSWMHNIHPYVDVEIQEKYPRGICPAKVTIHTVRGDFSAAMYQKGHPSNPFTVEDMADKFKASVPFSLYPIKDGAADRIVNMVYRLEEINNFSDFITEFNNAFESLQIKSQG